jgi:Skp family chaperone for outer membrane proteins
MRNTQTGVVNRVTERTNWSFGGASGRAFGQAFAVGALLVAGVVGAMVLGVRGVPTARAQQQGGTSVAGRVATVDMLMLVERVVMTAPYTTEMSELTTRRATDMQRIADRQNVLVQGAKDLDKAGEEFKAMQEEYLKLDEQFKQLSEGVQREIDGLSAKQVQRAFEQVRGVVDGLAKQEGYTHVIASRDAAAAFRAVDIPNTLQEVLAKGVIVAPKSDDLTEKAIDALGVRDVQVGGQPQAEQQAR